jgi:RNA polymerase sigma factor (TIGR02999 family)
MPDIEGESEAVSLILDSIGQDDRRPARDLLPLVYEELRRLATRRIASETPGQTLQATALVHEAYLRLVGSDSERPWNDRRHFFAAAAEAMRRILIDRARDRDRLKRGGGARKMPIELEDVLDDEVHADDLIALDEALEKMAEQDPVAAELARLRLFAGLSQGDAARSLGLARRTADRTWAFARAWLFDALNPTPPHDQN